MDETNQQMPPNPPPPTPQTPPPPGSGNQNNTLMAVLAYLGILIIIPLLTESRNDPFVKFHIKQGLVLLIAEIANSFFMAIPIIGWIFGGLFWIVLLVLWIMGIINALSGKTKELPLIGQFGNKFHF